MAAQKNEPNFAQLQGLLIFDARSPQSTHNPFADLLTGRISSFSQTSSQVKYYQRYKIIEPYFQDDWRATRRLTLNLGLRVSFFGTYRERYRRAYNFDPNAYDRSAAPTIDSNTGGLVFPPGGDISNMTGMVRCGVDGIPAGCMKDHLFNFAPRIGLAYDLTGTGKMAIRGAGNSVVFGSGDISNKEPIKTIDLGSKRVSALPESSGLFSPRWSPDGRYIAATTKEHPFKLMLLDFSTQK